MEDIYPEIALNQPKADPRTVLLHKRNFMESSSDHIQDFYKNSILKSISTTANCDKLKNMCKYTTQNTKSTTTNTTNVNKCLTGLKTKTVLVSKLSLETVSSASVSTISPSSLVPSTSSSSSSSSSLSVTSSSSSSSSSSLLSTILVNFSKSCHFNASFNNNNNNNLYKTQKTKLIFFLLFVWCAILLQTTQAVPVRRVSTSGRKLILHTNVYRERYHQKLLEEQRQHHQHQLQIQQQLHQKHQLQHQSLPQTTHFSLNHYQPPLQQQQVQKNHIFSPGQVLRRHPQPQAHHRHHLHQRAAPVVLAYQENEIHCNGNKMYQTLHSQMNASMMYIKQLCAHYLRDRGNESYESMARNWNRISLETRNPNRRPVSVDNELHREIIEFYKNLHNFVQLIDYASEDTNNNRTIIEHGEEIQISTIIDFLKIVKNQIKFNMREADKLMDQLGIEKPDLTDNTVEFNYTIGRRVRDFLIIKNLIEEFQRVIDIVQVYCENNDSE